MTSLRESQSTPAASGGRRLVPVRPYAGTVDGRIQQVGGYTQSREARRGTGFGKEGGPVETEKSVKPEADNGPQPRRVVISWVGLLTACSDQSYCLRVIGSP